VSQASASGSPAVNVPGVGIDVMCAGIALFARQCGDAGGITPDDRGFEAALTLHRAAGIDGFSDNEHGRYPSSDYLRTMIFPLRAFTAQDKIIVLK
jgi:hypothetical protein